MYPRNRMHYGLGQAQPAVVQPAVPASVEPFTKTPLAKALLIGALSAGISKAFPSQIIMPLAAGTLGAIFFGLVPKPETASQPQPVAAP